MNSFRKLRGHEKRSSVWSLSSLVGPDEVKLLVGQQRTEFFIPRKLLASCSGFFRERINGARMEKNGSGDVHLIIALEPQCPKMFRLFSRWIQEPCTTFDDLIEEATASDDTRRMSLHWDFVNLHLFAAQLGVAALQDLAMDALQDLYLQCDWDIKPKLIRYIYPSLSSSQDGDDTQGSVTSPKPEEAHTCRLRRWIVAMTAWTLGGVDRARMAYRIQRLFDMCPGFWEEYNGHAQKMAQCGLPVHLKNPQLRLPSNRYCNEERQFGYRQCSFHTHRSAVGQSGCPHRPAAARTPTTPLMAMVKSPSTDAYWDDAYDSSASSASGSEFGGSDSVFSAHSASSYGSLLDDIIIESDLEEAKV